MTIERRFVPAPGPARRDLVVSIALGGWSGVLIVVQAWLLSVVVDRVFLGGTDLRGAAPLLVAIAAVAALRAGASAGGERRAARAAARVRVELRDDLVRRTLDAPPAARPRERTGELANTLTAGIEATDGYVAQYLPQAALAAIVPATIVLVVLAVDPLSAVVLLVTYPLIPLFMSLIGGAARERTHRQWITLSRLSARFLDAIQALSTLKAFGRVEAETDTIARASARFRDITMRVLRVAFLSALVLELLATLGTAIVAVEVGLRLLFDRLAFQPALFVLVLAPEFYRPLRALGAAFHAGMAGKDVAARIDELLAATGPSPSGDAPAFRTGVLVPPPPFSVAFDRVTVAYNHRPHPAIDAVSFTLGAGQTVGLVGPSGSGKTTLANVLLRLVDPASGRVLVNGQPLENFDAAAWRQAVAWVPQRPHLFHGSVLDNLRIARPDASRADVARALDLASASRFVGELPLGLETPVGDRGERLSGGQAQRLAVARAFLKDAPVVVLDEPTSQLDPGTEAEIAGAIARLRRGRSTLLIAHRLTTVSDADLLVVLAGGRVVETGSPAALRQGGTAYARMLAACEGRA